MPHRASLLRDTTEEVVGEGELIVASQKCVGINVQGAAVQPEQSVIDVNGWRELRTLPWKYEGICWWFDRSDG